MVDQPGASISAGVSPELSSVTDRPNNGAITVTPPIVYGEDPGIGIVRGLPAPDLRGDGTLYEATVHGQALFFRLKP